MKKKLISIVVLLVMLISALAPIISGIAYGATPEELKLLVPVAKSEVESNPSLYNLIAYQEVIKAAGYGEHSTQYQDYLTKRQAITNMTRKDRLLADISTATTLKNPSMAVFVEDLYKNFLRVDTDVLADKANIDILITAMKAEVATSTNTGVVTVDPVDESGKSLNISYNLNKMPAGISFIVFPEIVGEYTLIGSNVSSVNITPGTPVMLKPKYIKFKPDASGGLGTLPYTLVLRDMVSGNILDKVMVGNSLASVAITAPEVTGYTVQGENPRTVAVTSLNAIFIFDYKAIGSTPTNPTGNYTDVSKKNNELVPILFNDPNMSGTTVTFDGVQETRDGTYVRVIVYENGTVVNIEKDYNGKMKQVVTKGTYNNSYADPGFRGTISNSADLTTVVNPIVTIENAATVSLKGTIRISYVDEDGKTIEEETLTNMSLGHHTIEPKKSIKGYKAKTGDVKTVNLTISKPIANVEFVLIDEAKANLATVTVIHEDEKSRKVLKEEKFDKVQAGKDVTYKTITIKDYKVVGKTEEKVTPKEGENIKIYFTYESVLDDKLYREIGQYNADREMTRAELDKLKSGTVITPVINIPPTLPIVDVKLKSGKFLNGYPDGTFKPGSGLTRNEAAVLINNVVQSGSSPVNATSSFVVDWAREAICKATSQTTPWLNLNTAVSPGGNLMGFRGDDLITREELAYALMSAYVQANNITVTASEGFSDTKGLASSDYIALGKAHGKLSGYPDGTFNPKGTITRAEATALVNGFVGNTPKQGKPSFSDVPENHWAAGHINAATK